MRVTKELDASLSDLVFRSGDCAHHLPSERSERGCLDKLIFRVNRGGGV